MYFEKSPQPARKTKIAVALCGALVCAPLPGKAKVHTDTAWKSPVETCIHNSFTVSNSQVFFPCLGATAEAIAHIPTEELCLQIEGAAFGSPDKDTLPVPGTVMKAGRRKKFEGGELCVFGNGIPQP